MSTLLTPIITQIELDRDRFKILVNGTESDTVSLENRTEKSIAGQVQEAIDSSAVDLTVAVSDAEAARADAISAKTSAETARDETNTLKNTTNTLKNQTSTLKDETQVLRDDVADQVQELENTQISSYATRLDLDLVYPYSVDIDEVSNQNLHLLAQPFDSRGNRIKWIYRKFQVIELNSGFTGTVDDINMADHTTVINASSKTDGYYVGNTLSTGVDYAWRFIDYIDSPDQIAPIEYPNTDTELMSDWIIFRTNTTKGRIDKPATSDVTYNKETNEVSVVFPSAVNTTETVSHARVHILQNDYVVEEVVLNNPTTTGTVQTDLYGDFSIKVQFIIGADDTSTTGLIISPWSDETVISPILNTVTTMSDSTAVSSGEIAIYDAQVHRVDGTQTQTLSFSQTPPTDKALTVVVFVNDSGGSITWPTSISWAGGNEPVLGTSWTNILLFWTGTMWIGMESAKK